VRRLERKVQAENDQFEILVYIGLENPGAAVELVQKIRAKIDGLRERPTLYRADRVSGTREVIVHPTTSCFMRADQDSRLSEAPDISGSRVEVRHHRTDVASASGQASSHVSGPPIYPTR
jgi:plasmid stabilization system protein ParE